MSFASISFAFASLAFLFLSLLLFTAPAKTLSSKIVRIAAITLTLWALLNLSHFQLNLSVSIALASESLRNLLLLLLLTSIRSADLSLRSLLGRLSRQPLPLMMAAQVVIELIWPIGWQLSGRLLILGHLIQSLYLLWLIEQLVRPMSRENRRLLMPMMLALGAMLAIDFVLYAEALLFGQFSVSIWSARGLLYGLTMPLMLLTIRRAPQLEVRVFVSRQVVYHSAMLLAAGCYLLVMAAAGFYLRYVGGSWGAIAQAIFVFLALLLLVAIFLSDSFRAKLRVFITKHFYANRYDYRIEWLKLNQLLQQCGTRERAADCALRAIAMVGHADAGVLLRCSGPRLETEAVLGPISDVQQLALEQQLQPAIAFCQHSHWIIDMDEYARKPQLYDGLSLVGPLSSEPCVDLIVPLFSQQQLIGLFALARRVEEPRPNFEDRDLLNTVSSQLVTNLQLEAASEQLAESKQFDAFNQMSAFLLHDLKNIVNQMNLIVVNGAKHKNNPEFVDDALSTIEHAVTRMQRVMTQLKKNQRPTQMAVQKLAVSALLEQAVHRQNQLSPVPQLSVEKDGYIKIPEERFVTVVANLIQNAQEACAAEGWVLVTQTCEHGWIKIEITDNGHGMSAQFIRERLFKPFDTTKGNAGMGIGAYEARQFMRQHGGELSVSSVPDEGTCFTISLPEAGESAQASAVAGD